MNGGLGATARAVVRLACTLALGVLVAAPLLFGPASAVALRAVSASAAHRCACGMAAGTCGCEECKLLARAPREARATGAVLRATCEDDDALPSASPLPPAVLAYVNRVLRAPSGETAPRPRADACTSVPRSPPPTPPPRAAS